MPSFLDPRRRTAICVLAAFAVGVLGTVGVLRFGPAPVTTRTVAAVSARGVAPAPVATTAGPARPASTSAPATATATATANDDTDDDQPVELDASAWPDDAPTPEQVFSAQPDRVRASLARLAKRRPGKTNVYAIAFAGDGSEDVFRNEAEYLDRLMTKRFASPGHTLVLENNPATLSTYPLASWTNLEAALTGLSKVMDPKEDVLLLYVATHGGSDHSLLVDMDPIPLDQLDVDDLADIFARHPFRWKVVVVNACYSGGFVPKLRGEGTLVMTSARTDRTSFGCGADSDITYFGRAWLTDGLNATSDFVEAFGKAKTEIAAWEKKDSLEASEPQIDVGEGIEEKLAAWRKGLKAGPVVPFSAR
ncbi:C13 family peptidase [Dyella sp. 333MFSha]|uniref:C13 family peptidase n=1 Tax=Dyella sp. 333MFSha TaxID=1798240 RepID=UPI0008819EA1|nr:C13 family peptidase [Dyella sp. 333MFSha]SDF46239.1 Peptidase C13 family protein [Dyella sp. 333MFSha]